jgi:class 3 adenylate cyclase/tetratricopeptide (TPR) repeat protein
VSEIQQIEQAIAALESQRAILGDAVVDTALLPLREKLAALRPRPDAEQRKLVTILFADLVGFTALSEHMDPEDVREITNAYFQRWTACIEARHGTVEKFIGDAVMAVFGMEQAREDDPENAVRAALAVRESLSELNGELEKTYQISLAVRVGIHTGPVVVSLLGERKGQDFVVVGDSVNTASRLQSACPAGGILISHDTYRHVRGIFSIQALDPITVKGKSEPIQVYLVQHAKPRSFHVTMRGVEGIETHLIGRELELKRLQDGLTAAIEDHEKQFVTLLGEAGVGKSRLIAEFNNWLELLPQGIFFFRGRATPAMQNASHSLLRDVFSFRFLIQDSDPLPLVRQKLEQGFMDVPSATADSNAVRSIDPSSISNPEPKIQERAAFIGQMLGFDFGDSPHLQGIAQDARLVRDRALVHLCEYFASLAHQGPVVILLEDIHWADDSSLDVVNHLIANVGHVPLLFVCAARPSLFDRRPYWGEGQPFHMRIDLQPLSRRDSRRLVDEILQKVEVVPAALRDLVVSNAEGNPFYIEELIKMLIEDGVIVKGDERWSVEASRLASVHVPPTLTGVLQARFDSLPVEERLLLQRAAVIGRVFWDTAVQYLNERLPAPHLQAAGAQPRASVEGDLFQTLRALRTREMIFHREESAFEGTSEYVFKHTLLRDVTYESLLRRDRRIYHAHAAQWLEQVTGRSQRASEYASLIAEHYDLAGETLQAAAWYRQAGEHAAAQFANTEALRCFTRALELIPAEDLQARGRLLLGREKVNGLLGLREVQQQDLGALEELLQKMVADSPETVRWQAEVLLRRSRLADLTGEYLASAAWAQELIGLAQSAGLLELEAQGYLSLGASFWRRSDYAGARPNLEQALALARQGGLPDLEADSLRQLGVTLEALGEYPAAQSHYEQALEIFKTTGNRRGESMAINDLGVVAFYQQDYGNARRYLEQALRLKRTMGDRHGEGNVLNNLGIIAYKQEDYASALEYYGQELKSAREIVDPEGEASALQGLGAIYQDTGDIPQARRYLDEALQVFRKIGDRQGECAVLGSLAYLYWEIGEYETASVSAQEGLKIAQSAGMQLEMGFAYLYLGHALFDLGRLSAADTAYQQGLETFRKVGNTQMALEVMAGLARLDLANGNVARAGERAEEILAALETSGAWGAEKGEAPTYLLAWVCWQVLQACGAPQAQDVLEKACRHLLEQADRIEQEPQRRAFLEAYPVHRELFLACQRQKEG